MKLLFDQNISPRLVDSLTDIFPDSFPPPSVALDRASDNEVWKYALAHGFTIVTRDSDFQERSMVANSAPKIVWIQRGNCSTHEIEAMLRTHSDLILSLEREPASGFVILL